MKFITILPLAALGASLSANAALSIQLPGNTARAEWSNLTSANHPGYPGFMNSTAAWPSPIDANAGSDGDASLNKLAGGGYPSSTSIYSFTTPGTFEITQSAPAADLRTVVWQLDHTSDFTTGPVLHFNGGNQSLIAQFTLAQAGAFSGNGPVGPFTSQLQAFQWDLSGVGEPITEYRIVWTGGEHQSIFTLALDEGDSFIQAIPEPSAVAFSLCGLLLAIRRRR